MLRRFAVSLAGLTVLLLLLIPSLMLGCNENQDGRDHLKVAGSGSETATTQVVNVAKASSVRGQSIEKETLKLENDLDSLSQDINDFGNFGLDSAATVIDRELDGF